MLFNNNADPNQSYETRVSNNIGPVTVPGGQKAGYIAMMTGLGIITIGIFERFHIHVVSICL